MADIDFEFTLENFHQGFAPVAHLDNKTFMGNEGQASEMMADVLSKPGYLTQSPALADLANGNQAGVVDQLLRYILDKPTGPDTTFALGTSKLFKLSSTAVINSGWPRTITDMTEGESITRLKNELFIFYNKASGGDIAVLPLNSLYLIRNPQTAADDSAVGTVSWSNPNNALSSNDSHATADLNGNVTSHYLKLTNFGFNLPSDAVIKGIVVSIERFPTNESGESITDNQIKLVKGGSVVGDNKALSSNWPTTQTYYNYGSVTDLWGESWAYSDINASNFGVVISAKAGSTSDGGIASIDHVKITVFYTSGDDGEVIEAWGSATDVALEKAPHPSVVKEDILMFGNGRYAGVYLQRSGLLDAQKLDFGEGAEVADVVFNGGVWWIAVNTGVGARTQGQIYVYDGGALSNILADEVGIGIQKIGFLYVLNGIVYVCYQELSSGGHIIGYLSGRQLTPIRYFAGSLPDHRQKTLYKNTLLFLSAGDVYSVGAVIQQLPNQVSRLADGGYSNVGAIAAPFGVPIIASSDGSSNHRLAKFSGYTIDSDWKSRCIDISNGRKLGRVGIVIVSTKPLAVNAKCNIRLEGNQGTIIPKKENGSTLWVLEVSGDNKMRHVHTSIGLPAVEDIRVVVDWENGNGTNDCPIRKIYVAGNYVEK